MEHQYDHNKGALYFEVDKPGSLDIITDTIKVHKWPSILTYEERSTILTIQFSNTKIANNFASLVDKGNILKIDMHNAQGQIWKTFQTDVATLYEYTKDTTIVLLDVDFWSEKNLIFKTKKES